MKTQRQNTTTLLCGLFLCVAVAVHAQLPFGGSSSRRSTYSSGQQYNPNGGVGNATISVDPDTRNLTVIADEETMKQIAEVIKTLDRPRPQVLIKVVFLEVQHSNNSDIGIEAGWGDKISATTTGILAHSFGLSGIGTVITSNTPLNMFGQPISSFQQIAPFVAGPGAGLYQVLGKDFQATLRAIAQAGKATLLSRPSIMARDSQPASIIVGQSVPLITSVRYDTFGNAINSVTYTDVGILLNVTPYITADGLVQMIVEPETSAINQTTSVPISTGVSAPVIDTRSADTVVVTPDGQTVVIGGLMRNDQASDERKIPFLGDIPLLGNIFKRKVKTDAKVELLIFLTPYIISAPKDMASLTEAERSRRLVPATSETEKALDQFLDKVPVKPLDKDKKSR
jgi:general secretion pathway protein D